MAPKERVYRIPSVAGAETKKADGAVKHISALQRNSRALGLHRKAPRSAAEWAPALPYPPVSIFTVREDLSPGCRDFRGHYLSLSRCISDTVSGASGKRVKSVMDGETILFAGAHYEVNLTSGAITKYYFAGASRIAMRKYTIPVSMEVEYLLGDHLGSTSLTTDAAGNKVSEIRYKPWGETRYTWTDPALDTSPAYAMTKYQYTGQFSYEAEFGLYFYNARWYDSLTGRFAQADTLVPGGVQGYDRYAYSNNSPVVYVDPSGHAPDCNGLSGYRCEIRQRKWREARHLGEYAYGEEDDGYSDEILDIYAMAGIAMESPIGNTRWRKLWMLINWLFGDESSLGPGKIYDTQMETDAGVVSEHGLGLGLRDGPCTFWGCDMDQNDPDIAFIAMRKRISLRLDECVTNGCTATDMFFVAMLAADEQITLEQVNRLFSGKAYQRGEFPNTVTVNWERYLTDNYAAKASVYLNLFSSSVVNSGYEVPNLDWTYINYLRGVWYTDN